MIYFARCGNDGPVKIGHTTTALSSRVSFLQVGCPWPISIIGTMQGGASEETALLRKFAHINMRGEWFHPASDLLGFIALNAPRHDEPAPKRAVVPLAHSALDPAEDWPAIIREIMRLNGWSQSELAASLGMHQAMISKWKAMKHGPNMAARIALRTMLANARERINSQQAAA